MDFSHENACRGTGFHQDTFSKLSLWSIFPTGILMRRWRPGWKGKMAENGTKWKIGKALVALQFLNNRVFSVSRVALCQCYSIRFLGFICKWINRVYLTVLGPERGGPETRNQAFITEWACSWGEQFSDRKQKYQDIIMIESAAQHLYLWVHSGTVTV